jgi:peptidyl-prolyl cis-trans isomerase D
VGNQAEVTADEIKQFYEQNLSQYAKAEERQASHILITVDKSGGDAAKTKARALAEQISNDLRKDPSKFAELAKKYSQDPGSAAKGGDLGAFSRGSMVKAFDDAVFSMKPGEISQPVESEYGYHVIRVTAVNPGQMRSFGEARAEIEKELKKQRVSRVYAETAEKLNAMQRLSGLPLIIGADYEYGAGMRQRGGYFLPNNIYLGGATIFPPQMGVGASRDTTRPGVSAST